MPASNETTLRQVYAALNEGADDPVEQLLDPEFVYRSRDELPGAGTYPARDFLSRLAELRETFSDIRFHPEEFISQGDAVFVAVRGTGVGRASSAPVEVQLFHVWTMADGRATALSIFSDRADALEAAEIRSPDADTGLAIALQAIRELSETVGPRRPCSAAERYGAALLAGVLGIGFIKPKLEPFKGYPTFAHPYGLLIATALGGALLQRRRPGAGTALAAAGAAGMVLESDLRFTPLSRVMARRESVNLTASVPAAGEERLRVCLCGHTDTTRSGLMFAPALLRHLALLTSIPGVSSLVLAARPLYGRSRLARPLRRAAIAGLTFSLAMLAERELRGVDVPGASDNASGAAVAAVLAVEVAQRPLAHTRVDLLVTGCEESGLLGAQAYARGRQDRIRGTLFVNFDTIGGDVPLTFILAEGAFPRRASPRLVRILEQIAADRPELGLGPAKGTPGLPTDATVMMARGEEAVTLLAQGDTVPHYHQPTDTFDHIHPPTVGRALETGREILARLDREAA